MDRRLLVVGNFLSANGGTSQICEEVTLQLAERGWNIVTTSSCKNRAARFFDMMKTVVSQHRNYDIAHVSVFSGFSFFWAESVCFALKYLTKPFILALHGGNLPAFAAKWPARVARLFSSAEAVVAPSEYLCHRLKKYRNDIGLIPNSISIDRYSFIPRHQARPALVWLRAFHKIYNPLMAIQTLNKLRNYFPDATLMLTGPDKLDGASEEAKVFAREHGLNETVRFNRQVPKDEVSQALNAGDIFLNTSFIDNSPVTLLEAMASGLCIVSTDVGGIPYMLENEVDALLVPAGDSAAMAAAVRRIVADRELARRLSCNGRKKAEQFAAAVVTDRLECLLLQIGNQSAGTK